MATTPAAGNLDEVRKDLAGRGIDTSFLSGIPSGTIDMRKPKKVIVSLLCPHCHASCLPSENMKHVDNCIDEGMF